MRLVFLLAALCAFGRLALAESFCDRVPLDPDLAAGLEGSYEIVGKQSPGASYAGSLLLAGRKSSYAVSRTIDGKVDHGDVWMEKCGADHIEFLVARYYTKPVTQVRCRLGVDGDNYFRATCRTSQGGREWRGLEAWFQVPRR